LKPGDGEERIGLAAARWHPFPGVDRPARGHRLHVRRPSDTPKSVAEHEERERGAGRDEGGRNWRPRGGDSRRAEQARNSGQVQQDATASALSETEREVAVEARSGDSEDSSGREAADEDGGEGGVRNRLCRDYRGQGATDEDREVESKSDPKPATRGAGGSFAGVGHTPSTTN
jgi:hypothetical protein